ncbi:bud site selection protein 20 [Suhomyces tanzawaensis NRRL Y-17324]|uniref:Bud site selection protein 20 n=1 Tax=Suhomyces tanzawaensis NRRL Y-17324 TaxID=984487 RepID=A0A1E4SD17_9ASCO|nr:bud site selection protein 20 [Suhomyces tanzawaensis NRRL Y-17324]ODV77414.1 bud site selection protein 20 [Suhomyces tanzawaensis NRRL Y-17324]
MGRYSVKRYKTKRRTRDLDLIYDDMSSKESIMKLKNQPLDETKPGLGQYYCIECAKYYENQPSLDRHLKAKPHRRRVKELSKKPYTPLESEAAAGVNLLKFMESVEKYKAQEQHKEANKEEIDQLLHQRKDNLDALITGIPSEEFQPKEQDQAMTE